MTEIAAPTEARQSPALKSLLENQRQAHLANPAQDHTQRVNDLKALARMIREHQDELVQAVSRDYGNRSLHETLFAEIYPALDGIKDTIKRLKKWMKPQRRHIDFTAFPTSSTKVIPQPLGVVGVIVPWNFPINLSFGPLINIFAAGNRAMVKMSENSRNLTALLARISGDYFPEDKLVFIEETGGVGVEFSTLKFDHLIFTGSGATGRKVMAAAAANLTPVTLELGGKSPAIVGPDYDIDTAVERVLFWKLFNAGQICTTVDYLLLPEDKVDAFVEKAKKVFRKRYPDIQHPDYTSVIDQRSFQRIWQTLDDAVQKGASAIDLTDGQGSRDDPMKKFPAHLLIHVSEEMDVMKREIFGPLLPIKTYKNREEVAAYINSGDRPLAIYPFTRDKNLQNFYIDNVMSGGVSVNNAVLHVGQHDIPFGGVGESGMGHYHGHEGFLTFSKLRPVFYQGPLDPLKLLMPPYGKVADKMMKLMLRLTK
ncbi:aldehyde dehydrogenase family protein [Microbulbifer sp. SH-1]|uniref:coniferyl aldehyde dehydrogenase n=1 Tax=Microbulbifer sp. SH-1 TaxID=2681547 RepID=UPI00140E8C85|nr:coniferyl aldehyde dehydrogenase [Microbulbifer sp. SH-1]QIL90243.1 aldehyde dehydrogenase family protein [Microbulbifer sp. SH-1]